MRILRIALLALLCNSAVFATHVNVDDWQQGQGEPSYYLSPVHHSPELHILGAYEGSSDHTIVATTSVHVQSGTVPLVLVVSSYESVLWSFTIDPGANVQRIILNGYKPQQITGAGTIAVTNLSPYTAGWLGAGYAYPPLPDDPDTNLLISNAQAYTGLTLESFGGAYQPHAFTVVVPEPAVLSAWCALLCATRRSNRLRK